MAIYNISTVFLLSLAVTTVVCQTFHYSNGWTNGKRAETTSLETIPEFKAANSFAQYTDGQLQHIWKQCELRKLKILLHDNANDQFYIFPCEFLDITKTRFMEISPVNQIRRSPTGIGANNY